MASVAGGRVAAAASAGGKLGLIGVGGSTDPAAIREESQRARSAGQPSGVGLLAWVLGRRPDVLSELAEGAQQLLRH